MAKIKIIKGSELPIVENINKATFLAYEEIEGKLKSGRIDFKSMTPLFGVSQAIGSSETKAPSEKTVKEALALKADITTEDGQIVREGELLDILQSYGIEISPINLFIRNVKQLEGTTNASLIVNSYNSLPDIIKSNARVALIPGAYKQGIIYGLNPRTGETVNFNFSRTTTATYFDDALNMHLASANTPRVDYLNYNNKPKILIEKATSNIAIQSEGVKPPNLGNYTVADITMCNFTKNAIVYPIIPSGGAIQYCYRKVSDVSGSFGYSFLVKTSVADMLKIGYSSLDKEVDFIVAGSYNKSTKINIDKIGSGLYRVQIFHNVGETNVDFNFGLNRYVGNRNTSDLNLTAFQLEVGETTTSYIPTITTQVTRSADNLSYTLDNACSVYLKTTKQNVVLDKAAGLWNIHNDLNNEGILELAIFDRVLTADEKAQLTA